MEAAIDIGFSNNIYDNPADVLSTVHLMSADFRAIEIELAEEAQPAVLDATFEEYSRIVQGLRQLAVNRELSYAVHAPWYGPHTDLTSPDPNEQSASVALLVRAIRFAVDIGAKVITCHPGLRHEQDERQLTEKLVDSLTRARDLTESAITVCIENMGAQRPSHALFSLDSIAEVCQRAGVGVCLDIVHLASVFCETADLLDAVQAFAPLVRHVHLADMIRPMHRHLPIGRGDLPLDSVLRHLAAKGYGGQAVVEEFNQGWAPREYLSGAITFRERARAMTIAR